MDESMTIIVTIVAIIILIINYMIAKEFYNIAIFKGYTDKKYLWFSFFFSIAGYLLVIALPDCGTDKKNKPTTKEDIKKMQYRMEQNRNNNS